MRSAQVYRWQIPMDAGVVLRERRLKTRDGLFIHLQDDDMKAGARFRLCRALAWSRWRRRSPVCGVGQGWRAGEATCCRIAFRGFWHQLCAGGAGGTLPQAADYRAAPLCTATGRTVCRAGSHAGRKSGENQIGLYEAVRWHGGNLLLEAMPDLRLRLDANRAWTPLKAQQFANM
jgi:O-succinylbenzoate synthase